MAEDSRATVFAVSLAGRRIGIAMKSSPLQTRPAPLDMTVRLLRSFALFLPLIAAANLAAGDWQDVAVELPAEGAPGIVRLYLPAQKDPVQLDWIELNHTHGKSRRWEF